ncbi:MAG: pentapeptide repeat-containing protein [Cyanobacteria bacterium P01_F01_bin.143]
MIAALVFGFFDNSEPEYFYIGLFSSIILVIFLISTFSKGFITGAFAEVGTVAFAGAFAVAIALVGSFARVFAITVARAFTAAVAIDENIAIAIAGIIGTVAGAFTLLGSYIGWRSLKGDKRDAWIRRLAVAFASIGGTNFQNGNLTDAIFTNATFKNTDFRDAILTRTCFRNTKKLDLARPGKTYLKNLKLQQWLTGTGQDNNFDGQDLRGVNFQGKNLTDASFIGADLNEANLQDADLSRAKLVQTKLDKTDFTGATLTGAFIEDWGITVNTILRSVKCDYIYLRLPTKENPDPHRKPDNRNENFAEGDFEDFIKPIFDTLDLYHNQNIDPRAIALAWKNLAENHPDANLRFAAMEVKGEDNLLLKLKTSPNTDKSQLNAEYFEEYNRIKVLNEVNKKLLAEKNERIQKLENMIELALKTPDYYVKGDFVEGDKSDRSRNQNIIGKTINSSGAGGLNIGDIPGTVANDINQEF